jgi:hypothetical protein
MKLNLEPVPPQYVLQYRNEDYLIRLLKNSFFLSIDGFYPFRVHQNVLSPMSVQNLTLPEFLIARGMTRTLTLLQ